MAITIEQARENIGAGVVYRTPAGIEAGVITGASSKYVFVRYGADRGSKATMPESLDFEREEG